MLEKITAWKRATPPYFPATREAQSKRRIRSWDPSSNGARREAGSNSESKWF